jgi:hypothetical protein
MNSVTTLMAPHNTEGRGATATLYIPHGDGAGAGQLVSVGQLDQLDAALDPLAVVAAAEAEAEAAQQLVAPPLSAAAAGYGTLPSPAAKSP